MRLNKICALLALLIFPLSTLHAQQFTIRGYAIDAYTTEMIDSVWVTLMGTDSTIIATHFKERNWGHFDSTYLVKTDTAGTFIVKFARKGYFDKYVTKTFRFNPHRLTTAYMNDVPMIRLPKSSIQLGEATVKATKLMMVMRGDTLVYNADAFQLAEGSMLDKLIAMLPGVELKKDGVITVNGRRVERLLVNGEDFFSGSPKVALENLPAYTVDEVKVYERMNDRDRALGYTKEEVGTQPLAMDVQLKKQFSMGGFANVGGAYGTDGHYGARLFGLRFTRQSRIGMYANINDFMGGSFYDSNGNWQAHNGGSLATTKDLGFYYLINDRRQRFKVDGSTRFWYLKTPTESKTSTTTFFDNGDVFSRTRQRSVAHELVADAAFNLQFTPPEKQLFMRAPPIQLPELRPHRRLAERRLEPRTDRSLHGRGARQPLRSRRRQPSAREPHLVVGDEQPSERPFVPGWRHAARLMAHPQFVGRLKLLCRRELQLHGRPHAPYLYGYEPSRPYARGRSPLHRPHRQELPILRPRHL